MVVEYFYFRHAMSNLYIYNFNFKLETDYKMLRSYFKKYSIWTFCILIASVKEGSYFYIFCILSFNVKEIKKGDTWALKPEIWYSGK